MNRTTAAAMTVLAASSLVMLTGCRVERTRGQRYQARAVDSVLQAEAERLATTSNAADYDRLVGLYQDLTTALMRSASGKPEMVQDAEDDLSDLAREVRQLPAYQGWSDESKAEFGQTVADNRLKPWKQWRGRKTVQELNEKAARDASEP